MNARAGLGKGVTPSAASAVAAAAVAEAAGVSAARDAAAVGRTSRRKRGIILTRY